MRTGSVLAALAPQPHLAHTGAESGETYPNGSELHLIEVCAGHAGATTAWREAGGKAHDEPIELYEDVDAQKQPRAHQDIQHSRQRRSA